MNILTGDERMVNDINTLNGSLQALGEKMASNLTTMGVPSTYDEGLNTLADKILQVAPVKTLDHINVELIAGNQILSYADEQKIPDSQYATVRFTAYDVDNNVIPNLALDFQVGSGAVTSVVTDANGGYEYTYHSQGVGDVEISASKTVEGSLVSESFVVYDYPYYANSMQKIKDTFIKDTSVSGRTIYESPFTFSSDVELEFKLKNIPQSWLVGFGSDGTTWVAKGLWFKLQNYNQNKASIMYTDTSGSNRDVSITTSYDASTVFTIKSENTHKIYWYLNGVVQASRDTHTGTPLGLRFDVFNNQDYDIEYIKVKPV